jgi:hypothetical protein
LNNGAFYGHLPQESLLLYGNGSDYGQIPYFIGFDWIILLFYDEICYRVVLEGTIILLAFVLMK